MEVAGSDEISTLTVAFNQMRSDIIGFMEKDRRSAGTITALNRDLTAQLEMVKRLKEQLAEENAALREEIRSRHNPGQIIGSKGSLARLMEQASQLASLPVTVLITGESGTGKELLARYLHEAGSRANGPFITVNCAALPAALFESELFGHEKGSFTGALNQKKGKFEIADGGTLFLDEVGEIPIEAQAKLLRALQLGEVSRVGSETSLHVDVRVVAATNRNLIDEVRTKRFRDDLYYRLKVVELRCPRLRERIEDLPALVQHFIEQYSRKLGKEVLGVSPSALELLGAYKWPGNIRELENMVARAVALATSKVLGPSDFTLQEEAHGFTGTEAGLSEGPADFHKLLRICGITEDELATKGLEGLLEKFEAIFLEAKLSESKSQKEAAEALGLTQTKLHRLLKKYGIAKHRSDA
ncbi:MAG: sigma-54-dependent Fis family transcriptional regulator [Deltaproteobacteria bacterium]|nr:sigma-54-dependent Fis family transcriptional regulator [Deltaproteobacteria bacterium]